MVDSPLKLVLNYSMPALLIVLAVGLVILNVAMCLHIVSNPEGAAAVFDGRSNWLTLMLYRSVLCFSRWDFERDLAPGTPFPALVRNCRRRAVGRLQLFAAGAVMFVLVTVITGHLPRFTTHM